MGLNPGSPKGLLDPSWFHISLSLLHTWKKPGIFQETPGFSRKLQDFPGIPAFQPGFGEKAGKPGIFTTFLACFFWEAPAGSELCSGVPFPWEFPLHSGLIAFVSGAN